MYEVTHIIYNVNLLYSNASYMLRFYENLSLLRSLNTI